MSRNEENILRMRHRISRLMSLILEMVGEILVNPGVFEPLYAEDNAFRIFALLPGLWQAYCQGWADYHAYEPWPKVGKAARGQLRPRSHACGATANHRGGAGRALPPSATIVTRTTGADTERALRRTGFMAQQTWTFLNLAVGNYTGAAPAVHDGVLMDSPQLAFFYVRGWRDHRETFRLDTDGEAARPRPGREFAVAPGTFVGPKQHVIMPIQFEVPPAQDPRRMLVSHYMSRAPDSQVVLELGSVDEADFDLHIDLVQVMNEEYYSRALYRYLNGDRQGRDVKLFYDENPVHDAWRHPPVGVRGVAEGSEDGAAGDAAAQHPAREEAYDASAGAGGVDVAGLRGDPVGQEDPTTRGEPAGSEEPMDLDELYFGGL